MTSKQYKLLLVVIGLQLVGMWLMNDRINMLRDNVESLRGIVYQILLASPPDDRKPYYPPDRKKEMET